MLIERDAHLARLRAAAEAARTGHGGLVLLGGEAGVGKSTLAAAAVAQAAGLTVRSGGCDDLTIAGAYGPLLEAVPELAERAAAGHDRVQLLRWLRDQFAAQPTLLLVEDVHWADGATLDALRYLGRRIATLPLLVLATYRSEAAGRPQLRRLLGELAGSPAVTRIELAPLTRDGVRDLVASAGVALDPDAVHAETGGNAFYVTEILAGDGDDLPATVRDAVLARTSALPGPARHALSAAAVLGTRVPLALIIRVAGCSADDVETCVAHGVLIADRDGCAFRHELARRAVESTLALGERTGLHRAALAALAGTGDDRRLAHHAVECGDTSATLRHSTRAGERAARLGAHREAAEHFRTALRHGAPDGDERAGLLEALSYECYLTEQLDAALTARLQRLDLAVARDDTRATGETLRWLSRLSWYLGRNADSERYAERAVTTLGPLGDSTELAMAVSNVAQLRMLAGDNPAAIETGRRALAIARAVGDRDTEIHALNNVGTASLALGDVAGGQLLERSLDLALAADAHEHAARAYTNLASRAVLVREFSDADRHLRAGIRYCTERDLDSWRWYMTSWLARLQLERGDLAGAAAAGAEVLTAETAAVTRIGALVVAGLVALRRGDPSASVLLDEALELARTTGEAQRLAPVAAARAEMAWLDGRREDIVVEVDRAWSAAVEEADGWKLGELCWWLQVAGAERSPAVSLPAPFAALATGEWAAAAAAWDRLGCPLWGALALAQVGELDAGRAALDRIRAAGVPVWERAVLRDRAAAGLPVPRGPRGAHRDLPHRLTSRELEVLGLLADGLSNSEIGARLVLSDKTVGHHVSAVLRKLGAPSRSRAVAAALREGIVGQR